MGSSQDDMLIKNNMLVLIDKGLSRNKMLKSSEYFVAGNLVRIELIRYCY